MEPKKITKKQRNPETYAINSNVRLQVKLADNKRKDIFLEREFVAALDVITLSSEDRQEFLNRAVRNIDGNLASLVRCAIVETLLNDRNHYKQLYFKARQESQGNAPPEPPLIDDNAPPFDIFSSVVELCGIKKHNEKRDVQRRIKSACKILGFDADNLSMDQELQVFDQLQANQGA